MTPFNDGLPFNEGRVSAQAERCQCGHVAAMHVDGHGGCWAAAEDAQNKVRLCKCKVYERAGTAKVVLREDRVNSGVS